MTTRIYCQECDYHINKRSKSKHLSSKEHLYNLNNIITNKYKLEKVYWSDFDEKISGYIRDNYSKFKCFNFFVKCNINNNEIGASIDNLHKPVYGYDHPESINFIRYNSKKIRDKIFYYSLVLDNKSLHPSSIIDKITITFYSHYSSMTAKHLLSQPRRVLESKFLKHIKKLDRHTMETKYNFLSHKHNLLSNILFIHDPIHNTIHGHANI